MHRILEESSVLYAPFRSRKKKNLMLDQNDYYKEKFKELRLEKRQTDYKYAISKLKGNCKVIGTHNTNICVCEGPNLTYCYIRKEHFEDDLNDEEKEECYRKIKKFVNSIPKAHRILKEWDESFQTVNKNFYTDIIFPIDAPCFNDLHNAVDKFHEILYSKDTPTPLQPTYNPTLNYNFEGQPAPKEVVDFLYQLCDGNIKNLQNLAKFSYKLIFEPNDCLSTVILANEEIHEPLREYFDLLSYPRFNTWYDELFWTDFKTLRLKEVRVAFLEHELKKDLPIILIKGDTIYKVGEAHSFFNKLFTGKKIHIDSPYFDDELIIKNSLPLIYVTKDEKKYRSILNLYNKIKNIKIETTKLGVPEKSSKSAEWLRNEFLCIGNANAETAVSFKLDHDMIVQKFLKICCVFGKNRNCSKQELYEAYKKYFEYCYPNEKHLGPIVFGRKVKEIKHERIEEYKPHVKKKGPYVWRFRYIGIKENYIELYQSEPEQRPEKIEKEKFEILLNELVKEAFKEAQLNKRRVAETIDVKH